MFTGIIEGMGVIKEIRPSRLGCQLTIEADFIPEGMKIGDSIAVSGACLTVITLEGKRFKVDVSPETLEKTTLNKASSGDRVNLERALRLSDRLDGHLVSGHIDGTGIISHRKPAGNAILIAISAPESLSRYLIVKGSVAIDGVSLTINHCTQNSFEVSIIPHTAKITTIGLKKVGEPVNIETDMIGKYVERFIQKKPSADMKNTPAHPINKEFLARTGFL